MEWSELARSFLFSFTPLIRVASLRFESGRVCSVSGVVLSCFTWSSKPGLSGVRHCEVDATEWNGLSLLLPSFFLFPSFARVPSFLLESNLVYHLVIMVWCYGCNPWETEWWSSVQILVVRAVSGLG